MYLNSNPVELSPTDIERLDALELALSSVKSADRAFFAKHPLRKHRLKRASKPEIEILEISGGPRSAKLPVGCEQFVAVRRITPTLRFRAFGALVPHGGDDPPESICRACCEAWWPYDWSKLLKLEERLRALHAEGDHP
jgi:hypothetical protein